jgi:hypothetical protein
VQLKPARSLPHLLRRTPTLLTKGGTLSSFTLPRRCQHEAVNSRRLPTNSQGLSPGCGDPEHRWTLRDLYRLPLPKGYASPAPPPCARLSRSVQPVVVVPAPDRGWSSSSPVRWSASRHPASRHRAAPAHTGYELRLGIDRFGVRGRSAGNDLCQRRDSCRRTRTGLSGPAVWRRRGFGD